MAGPAILEPQGLQALIDALRERGYRVIGPTVRDAAIVPAEITCIDELPRGVGDAQAAGQYRTRARDDDALFGFAAPAQSAKPFLLAADEVLWRGTRTTAGYDVSTAEVGGDAATRKVALLGVRGCDLAAIGIQDQVLMGRSAIDAHYASRRADMLLVAVTCTDPAGTCFCASMGTGPKPGPGADLTLTELLADGEHRFLAEAGTAAGEELLAALPTTQASPADLAAVDAAVTGAVARMGRSLDTSDLRDLLYASAESPQWNDVAGRCLACTNCTMVCPTCFCTSVEDVSDLSGEIDERHRIWDSCFSMEYSRLHGRAVRTSTAARYRQWLTHKLAAWVDQFGSSGCVGCGRCITWCPAGIDLTQEVAAFRRASRPAAATAPPGPDLEDT
ncbi:MAG: 4Fe-4S dicluster domain-containing protein [Candidatus Nanopelagicales bacterium]